MALLYLTGPFPQSNSQAGGPGSAEFRLMTTSLERALSAVRSKKQSRKLGRYEVEAVHRIQVQREHCSRRAPSLTYPALFAAAVGPQPSSRQYENAVKVVKQQAQRGPVQAGQALRGINIPLFRAQGLLLTRANGEVQHSGNTAPNPLLY